MTKQDLNPDRNRKIALGSGAVFACFASLYSMLRSGDIFAVDGAHRCLLVFQRQRIFFHENNHLLYPVNVLVWTRLLAALGIRSDDPFGFYRITELMNCFAAAAALAIVFVLVYITVSSWKISLAVVVALGLSKGLFEQATNANEAVVGMFWSLVAVLVLVAGLRASSRWLVFASGLMFSLSMATYESMIFLAPAALVLIWLMTAEKNANPIRSSPLIAAESVFLLGCLTAWLGIHGWADWVTGVTRPGAMIRQLFLMQDARSYLGLGPAKFLNLPVGLIRNVYPVLLNFGGFHGLLAGPRSSLVVFLAALAFGGVFFLVCAWRVWKNRRSLPEPMRIGLVAGGVALVFTLVPLTIWDPHYDKLWLQPLAVLAFLIAIALKVPARQNSQFVVLSRLLPLILLVGLFFNFPSILSSCSADVSGYFHDARDVYSKVGPKDLVVADWGKVSILYSEVWSPEDRVVDFITQAVYYGEGATGRLRESVHQTLNRGGHVYFLGLLDPSDAEWNSFLGSRCGVPFSDMDPYRKHSHIVATYRDSAATISLRQLDLTSEDSLAMAREARN